MAYTYEDFVAAANKAGLLGQFSQGDLDITKQRPEYGLSLLGLKQDEVKATTAEQKLLATEAANQLRNTYSSYSPQSSWSGGYGTQINNLLGQQANYGSFNYGKESDYQNLLGQVAGYGSFSYDNDSAYKQLLSSVVNQKPFSYDLQADPSWGSYKKAYLREGDRASANALAQASAASGGRPSSYATTAAQQAANYYAGQLSDMIPTLEQNAYQRYLNDFSNRLSSLGALENDRAFDYQNYLNQFSQLQSSLGALQSDRNFDYENWMNQYNMLQNSLGNYQQQDATEYQRYLDVIDQAYRAEQDAYDRAYQTQQDAYNREQDALAQQQLKYENEQAAKQQALAQQQLAYENEQTAKQQAFANALSLYKTLGYATPEVAEILGIQPGSPIGGSPVPDTVLSALKTKYPNSTVTNQMEWNMLVNQYGEEALKAAGYTFNSAGGQNDVDYNTIVDDCNEFVRNGKSKSEISAYLRAAYQEKVITQAEYNKLKEMFTPRGNTY